MFKPILMALGLSVAAAPAFAQTLVPGCLHGPNETAANADRRQQAIQYAAKVILAEAGVTGPRLLPPQYRPLSELTNLPPLPAGFDVQLHAEGRTYTFSLKDTRDPCHYAIFSDQDRLLYEGMPSRSEVTIVPLGTK